MSAVAIVLDPDFHYESRSSSSFAHFRAPVASVRLNELYHHREKGPHAYVFSSRYNHSYTPTLLVLAATSVSPLPCATLSDPSTRPRAPAPCARSSSLAPPGILPPPLHSALAPTSRLSRCPHIKEVCRNSAAHPRHDVIYLKNPEGQSPASLFLPLSPCGLTKDRDHSADVSRLRLL